MNRDELLELLDHDPVFDGHNDLPWALREGFGGDPAAADLLGGEPSLHTDVPKIRHGRLGAQFWSVFVPSSLDPSTAVVQTLEQIDVVHRLIAAYDHVFRLARNADDVEAAVATDRVASLIGMEGGHSIDSSLGVLRMMRRAGAAYMTLTHNDDTPWATSATGAAAKAGTPFGLTEFGRDVVREMNRIGMLVDLSHVDPTTMDDALDTTSSPVIFSHSSCRAITDHPRDVPDSVLDRLPSNGGVLMLTFVPQFVSQRCADRQFASQDELARLGLDAASPAEGEDPDARAAYTAWETRNPQPEATIDDVVAHLEHAREVVGVDHIGLGGDFDGVAALPVGIPDVSAYPAVLGALGDRGWSADDLGRLTYRNALRVLRAAGDAADPGFH